jgi:hypothetical protein
MEGKDCMGLPRYDIMNDPINTLMEYLSDPWVEKKPSASAERNQHYSLLASLME